MDAEPRRLHPLSWVFITAASVKSLILPAIVVLFASGTNPLARFELLSLFFIVPAFVAALLKQGVYTYRFAGEELVVRDGILLKKERHIPYERVHNVALVQNPVHRVLGVASARIETAAGGEPEAVMRVLSLDAIDELRHHTLSQRGRREAVPGRGASREAAAGDPVTADVLAGGVPTGDAANGEVGGGRAADELPGGIPAGVLPPVGDADATGDRRSGDAGGAVSGTVLVDLPASELVRLGLISNRGFIVVAAFFGLIAQSNWWDRDWQVYIDRIRESAPGWTAWLLEPDSLGARILLGVGLVLLFVVLLRVFSVCWYLVKYYGFSLRDERDGLRIEFGMFTRVSSLIPVHRIQLLTVSASLLHRWFGRSGIDVETAGASEGGGSELGNQLAGSGIKTNRQWLTPIIRQERSVELVNKVMPEVDFDTVEWVSIDPRATRRLLKKSVFFLAVPTGVLMAVLSLPRIPVSGFHALWLPLLALPVTYAGVTGWVRNAGYALSDNAVYFRSGWLGRNMSVVRFDKMQTVSITESPFDRRHRMASVAVDTAGAGSVGHRIDIPYLDGEVARGIFTRLYAEIRASEFRW